MIEASITVIFILVGLGNLAPVIGAISAERLQALYGIPIQENNLGILMRHRAILFGIVGAFLIYAGSQSTLQPLGFIAGFASMLTFIALALVTGGYNPLVQKVVLADVILSVLLLVALILFFLKPAAS